MKNFFPVPLSARDWQWFGFCALLSLGLFGGYYAQGMVEGRRTDLLVMYRPGFGDTDYLPLARQWGELRLGEGFTTGKIGEGWIAFPGASVLPHGLAMAVLGPLGFALADVVTPLCYFALGARLLMFAGATPRVAVWLASFSTLHGFTALSESLVGVFGYALHGLPFYLAFLQDWDLRFPRTFVSELYLLGALTCLVEIARAGFPPRKAWWMGLALWFAGVLQSDVYSFVVISLAFGILAAVELFIHRRTLPDWIAGRVALAALVFGLAALPFVLQRLFTSPDIPVRYGVFKVARASAALLARRVSYFFPPSFIWCTLALPSLAWAVARALNVARFCSGRLVIGVTTLQLCGYVALPCFVGLSGEALQLYHFRDAAHIVVVWSALVSVAWLASAFLAHSGSADPHEGGWRASSITVIALGALACLFVPLQKNFRRHLESTGPHRMIGAVSPTWAETYRSDWAALAAELDRPGYQAARTLATPASDLFTWWTGLRNRRSFLASSFASALPDVALFERLAVFGHWNQLDAEHFLSWITTPGYTELFSYWFANGRYLATTFHTSSTLDDYAPDERRLIATKTDPLEAWHLVMPRSERRKLGDAYLAAANGPARQLPLPDLLLLTHEFPQLRPDPKIFSLVYENRTFRLFRPLASPGTSE